MGNKTLWRGKSVLYLPPSQHPNGSEIPEIEIEIKSWEPFADFDFKCEICKKSRKSGIICTDVRGNTWTIGTECFKKNYRSY